MKKALKLIILSMLSLAVISLSACSKVDEDYGVQSGADTASENRYANVEIPEIASDDTVMPTYFDISLYDVENYADIYLGKKFEYKITYAGHTLEVPTTYKKITNDGWKLMETEECNPDSMVLAGKYMQAQFIDEYNTQIKAVFYNSSNSSQALKKCKIVKFIVPENVMDNPDSVYGQFWINGVSNESAITDVIEYLGAPSHFYAVSADEYYFDYFLTEDDKRNCITVYVSISEDSVKSVEFAKFK